MTVVAPSGSSGSLSLDVAGTPPITFGRLVQVEARKMRDTRAGFWLLLVTGLLLVLASVVTLLVTVLNEVSLSVGLLAQIMVVPLSLLLPVFAVTTVTSEWSQRTGLTTFALEPHRMRVVLAKLVTVVALAVTTILAAAVMGAITNVLHGALAGSAVDWTVDGSALAWTVVNQLLYFLMAFGFGLCLLSTPVAIVIYYVVALLLPFMVYGPIYGILSWGPDVVPWVDLGFALTPLVEGRDVTGEIGAQVAVTTVAWVVLPLLGGLWRVRRAEIT